MRHYFLDTSALVKLYVVEVGSNGVRDMLRSAVAEPPSSRVFRCDLSLPETVSALLQIERSSSARRGLSRAVLRSLLPRVRADFSADPRMTVIAASDCMQLAANIVERHHLRPADALQVAAALTLRAMLAEPELQFVSSDNEQCRAAEAEGLQVLRPAA